MTSVLVVACGVVGLLIGSFLNVVIHRVPQGMSVVSPPSACPRCGSGIQARDNVPVLSWVSLRGRCRGCAAPISWRYPAVELGTALIFVTVAGLVGWSWALPAYLYLAAITVALALIDLEVKRLPDQIVLPSYPVTLVLLTVASFGLGDWTALFRAVTGGVILYGVYGVLYLAKPGGMGRGDVKLAGLLGAYLAWWGWDALAVGGFAAFVFGGVAGVVLILLSRAGRKSRMPFGPYMLAGAFFALFFAAPVADWYLRLVGFAPAA
jgi:leader peptidase (prepilin peptidase)/N-methyltransferase